MRLRRILTQHQYKAQIKGLTEQELMKLVGLEEARYARNFYRPKTAVVGL
jgi:hypothetical protein